MAREFMTRKISSTKVTYATVTLQDGKAVTSEPIEVEFAGKLQEHQAHNKLNDVESEKFVVLDIEKRENNYRMAVADFIANAEIVNTEDKEENA